jgi:hypothetical protein
MHHLIYSLHLLYKVEAVSNSHAIGKETERPRTVKRLVEGNVPRKQWS